MRHCFAVRFSVIVATLSVAAMVATPSHAQTRNGRRAALERDAEIALARSAAPAPVSGKARIWVWNANRYQVADSGQSVVNCYVGRPWDSSIEPHCFDEEGSRTIMPILMRKVELFSLGKSEAQVDADIAAGLAAGRFKLPRRPAVTYMMSAAQQLVDGEGTSVGAWEPHLMIYYPRLTAEGVGLPGYVAGLGFVENPGQPLSTLVVPLKTFVQAPGQ